MYLCACHVIKLARNEFFRPVQGTKGPSCSLAIFLLRLWLTLNEQFLVVNTFQVSRLNNCSYILPIIHYRKDFLNYFLHLSKDQLRSHMVVCVCVSSWSRNIWRRHPYFRSWITPYITKYSNTQPRWRIVVHKKLAVSQVHEKFSTLNCTIPEGSQPCPQKPA